MEEKRIGIFGGVFDPVHNGHRAIAEAAFEAFSLTTLYIVPCGVPAHKTPPVLSPEWRLKLLDAVFGDDDRIVVSDIEIRRQGVSYTYETIASVRKDEGVRPYFFMGGDNLPEIATWRFPEKILEEAQVVVVSRPGFNFLEKYPQYVGKILSMPMPPMAVSSTQVREILKNREDASALVPARALEIILKRGFYK